MQAALKARITAMNPMKSFIIGTGDLVHKKRLELALPDFVEKGKLRAYSSIFGTGHKFHLEWV